MQSALKKKQKGTNNYMTTKPDNIIPIRQRELIVTEGEISFSTLRPSKNANKNVNKMVELL